MQSCTKERSEQSIHSALLLNYFIITPRGLLSSDLWYSWFILTNKPVKSFALLQNPPQNTISNHQDLIVSGGPLCFLWSPNSSEVNNSITQMHSIYHQRFTLAIIFFVFLFLHTCRCFKNIFLLKHLAAVNNDEHSFRFYEK